MATNKTFLVDWEVYDNEQLRVLDSCETKFDIEDFHGCVNEVDVLDVIEEGIRLIFESDIEYQIDRKAIVFGVAGRILTELKNEQE